MAMERLPENSPIVVARYWRGRRALDRAKAARAVAQRCPSPDTTVWWRVAGIRLKAVTRCIEHIYEARPPNRDTGMTRVQHWECRYFLAWRRLQDGYQKATIARNPFEGHVAERTIHQARGVINRLAETNPNKITVTP